MGKRTPRQPQGNRQHNERPAGTSTLSQTQTGAGGASLGGLSSLGELAQFSPPSSSSGRQQLFAQTRQAADADSVRILDVSTGQITARWASGAASERVSSLAWVELPGGASTAGSAGAGQRTRHKKRRKSGGQSEDDRQHDGPSAGPASSMAAEASSSNGHGVATSSTYTTSSTSTPALAIGLQNGSILLIHPTQSSVLQTLSHPSVTAAPVSMSFPTKSNNADAAHFLLWTTTAAGQLSCWAIAQLGATHGRLVAQYDTQTASCSALSVCYTSPSQQANGQLDEEDSLQTTAQILLGQFSIRLYTTSLPTINTEQLEAIIRPQLDLASEFSGHASQVSQLLWLDPTPSSPTSNPRFASIAKEDRFISVWSAARASGSSASEGLTATLGLDQEPTRLAVNAAGSVLCASSSDGVRLVSLSTLDTPAVTPSPSKNRRKGREDVKTLQVACTIQCAEVSGPCMDASLQADGTTVRIALGLLKPHIETLRCKDAGDNYQPLLTIRPSARGLLSGEGTAAPPNNASRTMYSEGAHSAAVSGELARDLSVPTASTSQAADPTAEPTIAERLKSLHVQAHGNKDEILPPTTKRNARSRTTGRIGDALSTAQSLVQALHSADLRLLEQCLAESNTKIIRATVRRVPNGLVLPLVEALVERLSRKRRGVGEGTSGVDAHRGQVLIDWLRVVLVIHLGYLVTLPSLVERLASLHATLESRMAYHDQLLALNGRLDLVVSQIDLRVNPLQEDLPKQATSAGKTKGGKQKPVPVKKYVEGESSESSSSEDEEDVEEEEDARGPKTADVNGAVPVMPAEEGDEEDIEDLVMVNGAEDVVSTDEEEDDDEAEAGGEADDQEEDSEDDIPALRKKKPVRAKVNGFLDVEAEESENEGSDEDGAPIKAKRGVQLNGVIHEDSLDEDDEDDLDRYESDFIDDDDEDEEEEGSEDEGQEGEDDEDDDEEDNE